MTSWMIHETFNEYLYIEIWLVINWIPAWLSSGNGNISKKRVLSPGYLKVGRETDYNKYQLNFTYQNEDKNKEVILNGHLQIITLAAF